MAALLHVLKRMPSFTDSSQRTADELSQAFACFNSAAGSLEHSYARLRAELLALRRELEERNAELGRTLAENRRINEFLNCVVQALPCGVLLWDGNGRLQLVNPEAARLLNLPYRAADEITDLESDELSQLKQASNGDVLFFPANQEWVAAGRIAFGDRSSLVTMRSVTDERRLEEERAESRRTRALADLVRLLAHEIRNPLASLDLFASLLLGVLPDGSDAYRWSENMQAGLRQIAATVNNVLAFHAGYSPQVEPVEAGTLLSAAARFLEPLAGENQVDIRVVDEIPGILVSVDPNAINQVLLNLALNSFRAMQDGGVLEMRAGVKADRCVELDVRDTGAGIAPDVWQRIFEPGYTTRLGNSGIGLAVCRQIIESHAGSIHVVDSSPERGTTIRIELQEAV